MEPNGNLGPSDQSASGRQGEANEFSGSGSTQSDGYDFAGTQGTTGADSTSGSEASQGIRDRARSAIGTAGDKLGDVGSTIRERAGTAKNRLADALESGADKLRRNNGGVADLAGATGDGTAAIADGRVTQVSDKVAGGMQATADWLREAELADLKTSVERQVKEHPGRTLLIAAGLGYLLGRAFRSER
jgi:hypothetical protein